MTSHPRSTWNTGNTSNTWSTWSAWSTHTLEPHASAVTKRFRPEKREGCAREWRALTLLAAYAPGLAPDPRAADLTSDEPFVVMSRVPGEPMRGVPLDGERIEALAAAVNALYRAVPPQELAELPVRPAHQHGLVRQIAAWTPLVRPRVGGEVREVLERGLDWLARSGLADSGLERAEGERADRERDGLERDGFERDGRPDGVPAVFGPGDGNLANYLWDGTRVRVVDFEDSGRSDRPFELAEITEHVGSWVEHPLDTETFLAHVDLTAAERARLPDCRRLLALTWLFLLSSEDPEHPRNPPGTLVRQAARLSALLDQP